MWNAFGLEISPKNFRESKRIFLLSLSNKPVGNFKTGLAIRQNGWRRERGLYTHHHHHHHNNNDTPLVGLSKELPARGLSSPWWYPHAWIIQLVWWKVSWKHQLDGQIVVGCFQENPMTSSRFSISLKMCLKCHGIIWNSWFLLRKQVSVAFIRVFCAPSKAKFWQNSVVAPGCCYPRGLDHWRFPP